jgi:peptidyl-prolyl cis-trans isomerase B (cyclophilin B)
MRLRIAISLAALVVASLLLAACGGDEEPAAGSPPEPPGETTEQPASGDGCRDVEAPAAREEGGETAPTELLPGDETVELRFETNCGAFVVTLDQQASPRTAASVAALAESGFYDGTVFHRIVPGFVIQGGDPTGTGTGGPGYSTVDTPAADTTYTKGVVAMAKTQLDPPGTAGSQFFVVTGDDVGLPPEYAVIGRVTGGEDVVDRIGELGDAASQRPTRVIVIERVEVGRG